MRKMNPDPKRKVLVLLTMLFVLYLLPPVTCLAAGAITIDDKAELLTAAQEAQLRDKYSEITQYMNIAFVSRSFNSGSTAEFARSYVHLNYPVNPAVIFFIDMENRNLYIYANRAGLRTISRADARAITDNVYKYASRGQYYECVDNTFSQILTLCQGGRIGRPIKHITNALIAVLFGILVNYFNAVRSRRKKTVRPKKGEAPVSVSRRMSRMPAFTRITPAFYTHSITYKGSSGVEGSDSGGGGGSSGGGGGGGGGGGHSF